MKYWLAILLMSCGPTKKSVQPEYDFRMAGMEFVPELGKEGVYTIKPKSTFVRLDTTEGIIYRNNSHGWTDAYYGFRVDSVYYKAIQLPQCDMDFGGFKGQCAVAHIGYKDTALIQKYYYVDSPLVKVVSNVIDWAPKTILSK